MLTTLLLFAAGGATADLRCYKLGHATICEETDYNDDRSYYCYQQGHETICEED